MRFCGRLPIGARGAQVGFVCAGLTIFAGLYALAAPPFSGTIFIAPDVLTASDPTTLLGISYAGRGMRRMFDRRVNTWTVVDAYLLDASFDDGLKCEIQVNPEFGSSDAAQLEADKYASVIGRLPTALRADVQTVWIHRGVNPFGGGNNNLLIHTGQADLYAAAGILEETLVHEASHTSLDAAHATSAGWVAAQTADGEFISTYARDYPDREDVAESFLPYLAIRHRPNRISPSLAATILRTIPNRIAYFDERSFNMHPIAGTSSGRKPAIGAVSLSEGKPGHLGPAGGDQGRQNRWAPSLWETARPESLIATTRRASSTPPVMGDEMGARAPRYRSSR